MGGKDFRSARAVETRGPAYTLLFPERAITTWLAARDREPPTPAWLGGLAPHQNCITAGSGRDRTRRPTLLPAPLPTATRNARCERLRQSRWTKSASAFRDTRYLPCPR